MSKELFQDLYAVHSRQIFSYLLGRTNDKEIAADLLQDIFLKAWNRIDIVMSIPDDERLYWLFAVASNQLKDYYRKSSYRRKAEDRLRSDRESHSNGDLSGVLAGQERFRELETHINRLPEELRCMLVMKAIGRMNSTQIGNVMNQPPGTIRYKIAQARLLLAESLKLLDAESVGERRKSSV